MIIEKRGKIDFKPMFQFITANYSLQKVCWIDPEKLFIIDTLENGYLIDIVSQKEVEKIELSQIELVYENANFKSLANGGHVSRAMASAGEHACENSIASWKHCLRETNYLYILGSKTVFRVTLRDWNEKIEEFLSKHCYSKAFKCLEERYSCIQKSSFKLDSSEEINVKTIKTKIDQTLTQYLKYLIDNDFVQCQDPTLIKEIVTTYLNHSIYSSNKYEKVFDLFEQTSKSKLIQSSLIENLEQLVFDDELVDLSPLIVKHLIDYYIEKKWFNLLDALLTHLNIFSLDIDFIFKCYRKYLLYDSYIYIHNVAFQDFFTPLDDLIEIFKESAQDALSIDTTTTTASASDYHYSKIEVLIGNKLLIYLNCMLTCCYYPNKGKIPDAEQEHHLDNCYRKLLEKNSSDHLLDILILYDCNELLNSILIGFDYLQKEHPQLIYWIQILVDHLVALIVDDPHESFVKDHRNSFFIFLGRCLINSDDLSLEIRENLFHKMIDSLFESKQKRFDERQQTLLQLMSKENLRSQINKEEFLGKATSNNMFKILEQIFLEKKDWINLFEVYIKDTSKNVWEFF